MHSNAFPLTERNENQAWYRCSTSGKETCEPVLGHIPKRDHFFWADSNKDEGYVPVLREDRTQYPLPLRYYLDAKKCDMHCHKKDQLAKNTLAMSLPRLKISDFASPQYISSELARTHPGIASATERYLASKMPPLERIIAKSADPRLKDLKDLGLKDQPCKYVFGEDVLPVIRKHLERYQTECIENKLAEEWVFNLVFDYLYMRAEDDEDDENEAGDTRTILLFDKDRPVLSIEQEGSADSYMLRNVGEGQIPPLAPIVLSAELQKKVRDSFPSERKKRIGDTPLEHVVPLLLTGSKTNELLLSETSIAASVIVAWLRGGKHRNVVFCFARRSHPDQGPDRERLFSFPFLPEAFIFSFWKRENGMDLYIAPWIIRGQKSEKRSRPT